MCWISVLLCILVAVSQSYSSFIQGQVRNEALHYLYSVGQRYLSDTGPGRSPLKYINDPPSGRSVADKLVKEVVGVVCGDYPYDGERGRQEIKTGCKLFEWVTAHYLAFISVSEMASDRSLTRCVSMYPNTDYTNGERVTLARVRDLIPLVCNKLNEPVPVIFNFHNTTAIVNARDGCRKFNDIAADYLTVLQLQEGGPGLDTYKRSFTNTPNRPGLPVTYEQVSQSLPIVCEGDVVPSMSQSCSFFHTVTLDLFSKIGQVLNSVRSTSNAEMDPYNAVLEVEKNPQRQMFPFHRAKPFFIHYCRNTEMRQTEKLTCRYLLTEHVELLVHEREKVLGRSG